MTNEPKKAEIELVGGTTITGKVVTADVESAKQAAIGSQNTQVEAGGNITGRDDARHQVGSVTFQSNDNAILWNAIISLGDKIGEVREKLDDLPNRVAKLEVARLEIKVDPLPVVIYPPLWVWIAAVVVAALIGAFFAGRGF